MHRRFGNSYQFFRANQQRAYLIFFSWTQSEFLVNMIDASLSRNCPFERINSLQCLNWPGGAALSFSHTFHHWLMLYTLGQYIVNVQWSTTSDRFLNIFKFGICWRQTKETDQIFLRNWKRIFASCLWWYLWILYDNFGVKENIWCDIWWFEQSEEMNIKLILHSVWKFWQIAINSIAKKSLIWTCTGLSDSLKESCVSCCAVFFRRLQNLHEFTGIPLYVLTTELCHCSLQPTLYY